MVSRYSLAVSKEKIFNIIGKKEFTKEYKYNYNIAPQQKSHIITQEMPEVIQYYTWGLLPSWTRQYNDQGNLYNARAEGISAKASYRIPIRQQRCLLLADSFYLFTPEKKAYRIFQKSDNLLLLAGVYDVWNKEDKLIKTYSMITCPANRDTSNLNAHSPVILTKEEAALWLDSQTSLDEVLATLKVNDSYTLSNYQIHSNIFNNHLNDPLIHEQCEVSNTLFD